jgi:type 1 fimbriae regulatory protein FimB/type 1 fimbriae regulatory protein FimE
MLAKADLRLASPKGEKWKVMPKRRPNAELRAKEYLTEAEIGRLMKAARKGRWGHRDATLILVMVRHGLRVTEACDLVWDQINWSKGHLHVKRLKGGIDSVHTIQGDELRALRRLQKEQAPQSAFVFTSERGGPFSRFAVNKMIEKAGEGADIANCHPHMLRHACGHLLADAGHDTRRLQLWLGHSDIKHTARYSELSAKPFKNFWRK